MFSAKSETARGAAWTFFFLKVCLAEGKSRVCLTRGAAPARAAVAGKATTVQRPRKKVAFLHMAAAGPTLEGSIRDRLNLVGETSQSPCYPPVV